MNDFILIARFNDKPSEERRKEVKAKMKQFINNSMPSAKFETKVGDGSWWIAAVGIATPVLGWLGIEIAKWAVKKGLDLLSEKFEEGRMNRESDMFLETEKKVSEVDYRTTLSPVADQNAFDKVGELAKAINGLALQIGADTIQFGEWSSQLEIGRIVSLKRDSQEVSISFYQTDSRDDFNSRTSYP